MFMMFDILVTMALFRCLTKVCHTQHVMFPSSDIEMSINQYFIIQKCTLLFVSKELGANIFSHQLSSILKWAIVSLPFCSYVHINVCPSITDALRVMLTPVTQYLVFSQSTKQIGFLS